MADKGSPENLKGEVHNSVGAVTHNNLLEVGWQAGKMETEVGRDGGGWSMTRVKREW